MQQPTHLDRLATEFFSTFSRFEYSLKASGFNNGDGPAEANWSLFAKAMEHFVSEPPNPEVAEAIASILSNPPKKQFVTGGKMEWREIKPTSNSQADALFQYIRRIRNNLFHGGKFNGHWFEPERSELLLRASLTVLVSAVETVPAVRDAYRG